MTVDGWNAQRFHEQFSQDTPTKPPRRKLQRHHLTLIVVSALVFGAVATAATDLDGIDTPDRIGVCHATGNSGEPYVFLVVADDSFEHAHHRQHDADFFRSAGTFDCGADALPAQDNSTVEAPAENQTAGLDDAPEAPGDNTTQVDEVAEDNVTDDAADEDPVRENGTEEVAAVVDAWVVQDASQDDEKVVLTLVVGNGGDEIAHISLEDELPDVRRTWFLGGPDAESCVLEGSRLSCWFTDVAPGESRMVELHAYTDRMPCGFSLTNTAHAFLEGDGDARNDASSAGILARAC